MSAEILNGKHEDKIEMADLSSSLHTPWLTKKEEYFLISSTEDQLTYACTVVKCGSVAKLTVATSLG
ncbi:hypothetical protein ACP70R_009148 [Stipagrostis hirtigluma subsp. patula]